MSDIRYLAEMRNFNLTAQATEKREDLVMYAQVSW